MLTRETFTGPWAGLPVASRRNLRMVANEVWQSFRSRCLRLAALGTQSPHKTRSRPLVRLCRTGLPPVEAPLKGFCLNFP